MLRAKEVVASGDWSGHPADSVVLEFDERSRQHGEMKGVGGLVFTLDLPKTAMLRGGDALKLDDGRIVEVVAAPEPLMEIRAEPVALLRIALGLGNAHALVEASAKALRVRRDSGIEAMAKAFGARVIALDAPFNPEGAAYLTAAAHAHDHDHGHRHDHGHHDHGHHGHDHHGHGDHGHAHHDHGEEHHRHEGQGHESAVHHHSRREGDRAD